MCWTDQLPFALQCGGHKSRGISGWPCGYITPTGSGRLPWVRSTLITGITINLRPTGAHDSNGDYLINYDLSTKQLITLELDISTGRKRSLGEGNVFTLVCHSVHRWGVCVPACSGWGLYPNMQWGKGMSTSGSGGCTPPWTHPQADSLDTHTLYTPSWVDNPPPHRDDHWSGRYASYWNAFLLLGQLYRNQMETEMDRLLWGWGDAQSRT